MLAIYIIGAAALLLCTFITGVLAGEYYETERQLEETLHIYNRTEAAKKQTKEEFIEIVKGGFND